MTFTTVTFNEFCVSVKTINNIKLHYRVVQISNCLLIKLKVIYVKSQHDTSVLI